jgi:hypothetical protein
MRIAFLVLSCCFLIIAGCSGGGDSDGGDIATQDAFESDRSSPADLPPTDEQGAADSWQPDARADDDAAMAPDLLVDSVPEDGEGPECQPLDDDCDGIPDGDDNCPATANPDQDDFDDDGAGDACDDDDDDDGVADGEDAFPYDPDEWSDVDGDGIGDNADTETCDGMDNDGDGLVDEELPVSGYYPDQDGDGYGSSQGTSCASLLAEGNTEDGIYEIRPASLGGPSLDVYCDMTTDGGGWTRIFFHDVSAGYFLSNDDAHASNVEDPTSGRYSILHLIDFLRSSDGTFELRLNWPESATAFGRNIWRQESNPTTAPVAGYQALSIDHTEQYWGGIELSTAAATYLDGSVGHSNWFYSVGSQVAWGNPAGIPAYGPPAERVALWVRPDDDVAGGAAIFDCKKPANGSVVGGDCDDTRDFVYPGAPEQCNGFDDDCDGIVDEECPFGDLAFTKAPKTLQFYARNLATDTCTITVEGETLGVATEVLLAVSRDGEVVAEAEGQGNPFAVSVEIEAGLHLYELEVKWDNGSGWWKPASDATFPDIVCGDVYLIDGQSNAVAVDYHGEGLGDVGMSTFVRSFGSSVNNTSVKDDKQYGIAVANNGYTHGAIGQWGLQLALDIMEAQEMPLLVLNGAVGGTMVSQHQRNDADPTDVTTIYGRLLWRVKKAGVADRVRGIFWHQGESDGSMAYETYLGLWTAMYEDWLEDYPNVEGIYPFQVRAGCGNPTWNRNVHRDLPGILDKVIGHMSTTGVTGHDGCHFYNATYVEWGHRMARLVNRDLYGDAVSGNIEAPDPAGAKWLSPTELEIQFGATGNGLTLQPGAEAFFSLSDGKKIAAAAVVGTTVVLTTNGPSSATWVSFVDTAGDIPWLVNDLGIGSFAFYQLPVGN